MGYIAKPNDEELSMWKSGEQVRAITAMRARCEIPLQIARRQCELYAMGETEKSLDPLELLKRIHKLENQRGIKW